MKLLVYVSRFQRQRERVRAIGRAAIRVADDINAEIEIKPGNVLAPHVYYINSANGERRLLYTDWGKSWGEEEVYDILEELSCTFHTLPSMLLKPQARRNHAILRLLEE